MNMQEGIYHPGDDRVKELIGKKVFYFNDWNEEPRIGILTGINTSFAPFSIGDTGINTYHFIAPYHEPEIKYVPFDLSKEEDRAMLRGKWVRRASNGDEAQITALSYEDNGVYLGDGSGIGGCFYLPEKLMEVFVFVDTGKPCGKEVRG